MTGHTGKTPENPSDEELISSVQGQDAAAIEELYRRHAAAGLSYAKKLLGNGFDADDVSSEAFLKVIHAIQRGNGPDGPFRPYLLRAIKTSAADHWTARSRHELVEEPMELPHDEDGYEHILHEKDRELAGTAFASLPARWQTVLWHVDVEGERPRQVGPLLGLEPNAVSAIAARARKGLRLAYLEAYVDSSLDETCKPYVPLLAKSVVDGLSPFEDVRLQKHLAKCLACTSAATALMDVRSTMRRAVAPWLVGPAAVPVMIGSGAVALPATTGTQLPGAQATTGSAAHSAGMGIGAWAAAIAVVACVATGAIAVATGLGSTPSATDAANSPAEAGPLGAPPAGGTPADGGPGPGSAGVPPAGVSPDYAVISLDQPRAEALQVPLPVSIRPIPTDSPAGSTPETTRREEPRFPQQGSTAAPTIAGPTPGFSPTSLPTSTPLPTNATPAPSPSETHQPSPTATPTQTPTVAPTPTPTSTSVPTPTPTPTVTPGEPCPWWWWFCTP
jgi:RNA polymerase sigma factor (sigma-70 family)